MRSRNRGRPPLQRAWHAVLWLLGVASGLAACVDSGGGDSGIDFPTLIAVSPQDFLGGVRCANAPGAMRRYVATLYDVSEDVGVDGFALPSSGPVDCRLEAKFGMVVPGRRYVARVDGYDRTDIRPLGAPDVANSGSPVMVDAATGEYVAPRWTSACSGAATRDDSGPPLESGGPDADLPDAEAPDAGADSDVPDGTLEAAAQVSCNTDPDPVARRDVAVTCVRYLTRRVAACSPLCDGVGPGITGLSVSLSRALDTLQCGNGPGQVATFRVEREGGTEPPQTAACGQVVIFTEGIAPSRLAIFKVTAFENGSSSPSWETRCHGEPALGTVLPVSCDPLVSTGNAPKTDL
jgi:hypothetical protein